MRKVLLLLSVSLVWILAPVDAQSRSVFWERWDVTITDMDLDNNTFLVQEAYTVRFDGEFSFGSAVIPDENLSNISDVTVYQNGERLSATCTELPSSFCVERVVEGVSITYYFRRPIRNAVENFTIEYRVAGALRSYEGGDQLWWTAVPEDKYGFSVGSSTITVELPPGYAPRETIDPVETYGVPATIRVNGSRVMATATERIGANNRFELRVQYPHNEAMGEPYWQSEYDSDTDFRENVKPLLDLVLIAVSLLLAIAAPLGVYALWYTRGRDPKPGLVPSYLSEPPSNLPPAVVGTMVDEKAETRDIMSTLIDLGHRGYVVIEENRESNFLGLGSSSSFTFKRTDKPSTDLRLFEQSFIKDIFGNRLERDLESLKHSFYAKLPGLKDQLYNEMVQEGLFTANPNKTRAIYTGYATLLFFGLLAVAFFVFGAVEQFTEALLCLPASMSVGIVALAIAGNYMPRKTQKGAQEVAKWEAFREYLRNLEKYTDADGVADKFDAYLPYAIVFGLERTWINRFARVERTPMPTWYYPRYRRGYYSGGYRAGTPVRDNIPHARDVLPGDLATAGGGGLDDFASGISGGLESMASGLSNMLESASRTLTSTPPSSSGSSGSWSGGGGSWSGGGSFGGGSSGGGSRGFG